MSDFSSLCSEMSDMKLVTTKSRLNSITANSRAVRYLRVSALYYARRTGAKQSHWAKPKPLKFYTTNIEIGGTKLLVITELKY